MPADQTRVGDWGISEELWAFVEEMPYERRSILAFVREVADSLPSGTVVLDVGAGQAPYRELFAHCDYTTTDWDKSVHEKSIEADVVASADALPLADESADAVLLTQVLEHVPDPLAVLQEMARLLRPAGQLFLSVPFVWELHELPYDFWRFTPASLQQLLTMAGFHQLAIEPRTDCFTTLAQLLRNAGWRIGSAADGGLPERERAEAVTLLSDLSDRLAALAPLDVSRVMPLGFTVKARRADARRA